MLFSLPRVFVVVVVALVGSGMAAPTAITTPTSLDERVKELEVKVTKLALPIKAKDVTTKSDCNDDYTCCRKSCLIGGNFCYRGDDHVVRVFCFYSTDEDCCLKKSPCPVSPCP